MQLLGKQRIDQFKKLHANSRRPLDSWAKTVEEVSWKNFPEVKDTFNSVDYVKPNYIFNIGGNKYRITAGISFISQLVTIYLIETHAEYSKRMK